MAAVGFSGTWPLLAVASIVPGAVASVYLGFGGYGEPFLARSGPFDANSTAFLDAVAASNSTGLFKIPGYDVSKPYPGEPADGWTISVAALNLSQPFEYMPMDPMIGYSLKIQAPDSLLKTNTDGTHIVNAHPSWGMCMWNFNAPELNKALWNNPTNKPLAEDGSCKGFLSDACIAALENAAGPYNYEVADSANTSRGIFGSVVTCNPLSVPDECGPHGPGNAGGSVPSYGGVPVPYLNGSVTVEDGWLFERDKGKLYNSTADLQLFYDSLVLNYWTIVTVLVNATIDPNATSKSRSSGLARVHCIAPNGVGTGKGFAFSGTSPNAQGGSGGGGNGANNGNSAGGGKDNGAGVAHPTVAAVILAVGAWCVLGGWTWMYA